MDCNAVQKQIELYLDDEVTLSDKRDLEAHLEHCSGCQESLNSLKALGSALRQHVVSDAPSQLRSNVRGLLKDVSGEDNSMARWAPWLSLSGGAFALVGALIWGTLTFNLVATTQRGITDEIIAVHIRSLLVDHIVDVRSVDTHTVKPWFTGKLDFSPMLKDLSGEGFLLAGGRLEYIKGKTGSALVYKRREHLINVFTIRSGKTNMLHNHAQEQGYNIIYWSSSGLSYWVVSDLNMKELRQFADLYAGAGHKTPS